MSFSDLKVSEDLSIYNSSRQNIISRDDLGADPVWRTKDGKMDFKYFARLLAYYKVIVAGLLVPIVLSPLLLSGQPEYKCLWCVFVLSLFWTGELIPLPATALFPLFLFPLTGIMTPKAVAKEYMNDTVFLFIGGLVLAAAVEKSGLHERTALRVLTLVGSQPKWVMFGFMIVTAVLSMFISNTATTAMMVPIAQSVIEQLEMSLTAHHKNSEAALLKPGRKFEKGSSAMCKGMIVSICLAANIGGTGTVTGTPPNLVLLGQLSNMYPGVNTGMHYLSFFVYAFPLMVICLLSCWAILVFYFLRNAPEGNEAVTQMMHDRYAALPPVSFAEKLVAVVFTITLLLWLLRAPEVVPGFGDLFEKGWYTDATSAMIVVALLFILPAECPKFSLPTPEELDPKLAKNSTESSTVSSTARKQRPAGPARLMDWSTMMKGFPWSVVWLLGGGFSLAAGVKESGLSTLMGSFLASLDQFPLWSLQLICIVAVMVVTNICSNTVTASIFIPIAASLAERTEVHPLTLVLPTTIACSMAFVLPIGTPPNAIVFSSGMLTVTDMIGSGLLISAVSSVLTVAYMQAVVPFIFDVDTFPEWARLAQYENITNV